MIRSLLLSLLLLGFPVLADEAGPAKEVPELQPLSNYAGNWTTQASLKIGDQVAIDQKGKSMAEWIHNGRFVRQTWSLESRDNIPALSGSTVMTYDGQKKTYRAWLFNSTGSHSEAEGAWDAKARTFTWTTVNPDGNTTVTKAHFPDAETEKWTITLTDRNARVLFVMQGTNKRQK